MPAHIPALKSKYLCPCSLFQTLVISWFDTSRFVTFRSRNLNAFKNVSSRDHGATFHYRETFSMSTDLLLLGSRGLTWTMPWILQWVHIILAPLQQLLRYLILIDYFHYIITKKHKLTSLVGARICRVGPYKITSGRLLFQKYEYECAIHGTDRGPVPES